MRAVFRPQRNERTNQIAVSCRSVKLSEVVKRSDTSLLGEDVCTYAATPSWLGSLIHTVGGSDARLGSPAAKRCGLAA